MKIYRLNSIVLVSAWVLAAFGTSHAEPSPDLMNSIGRLRQEAQRNSKAEIATVKAASACITYWSWSGTRTITAGQNSVAVPDHSHRTVAEGTSSDFKAAPLQQGTSNPARK
jgi:hypothetical protein